MMVKNPKFKGLCGQYNHLEGVNVSEGNRDQIPVHVVLGASEYASVKTSYTQKVGQPGQPVPEKTLFRMDCNVTWKRR